MKRLQDTDHLSRQVMDLIKALYTMGALSVREMKDLRTLHRDNEKISKPAASVVISMKYATSNGGSRRRFFYATGFMKE